jgi:hypothetical protein
MLRRDRWQNMESGRCWTAFGCFGKLTGMEGQAARNGFRAVSLACASLALALALMTFVGWISELPLLASVRAKYIPMAPSSALCFSLIDIGIIMQIVRPVLHWFTRVLTVLVLAIACVKLVEFLGGFHFEIDAWFVRNPGMFGAVPTGRMAPMTALNFVFLAGGLLTLVWRSVAAMGGRARCLGNN